jgi:hypothetical protein
METVMGWITNRAVLVAAAAVAGTLVLYGPVHAAGGGSSGSSGTRSMGPRLDCPNGWELSSDKKKCVPKTSGLEQELPAVGWDDVDEAFVEAAVLAHSGAYARAIDSFKALGRPNDPYVLNYLGFSHRKLGRTEEALGYYHAALAIRPDYVRARAYLGEGLLELGRADEARRQLGEIAERCGTECDAYKELDAAMNAWLDPAGQGAEESTGL